MAPTKNIMSAIGRASPAKPDPMPRVVPCAAAGWTLAGSLVCGNPDPVFVEFAPELPPVPELAGFALLGDVDPPLEGKVGEEAPADEPEPPLVVPAPLVEGGKGALTASSFGTAPA